MEKNYKLYMHTCPNRKIYFGITSVKVRDRWSNGRGYINNEHFTRAINKYGWDNIEHLVLAEGLTREEACHYEEVLIAYFDTMNPDKGYNKSKGGETNSGWKLSDEVKRKISEANKGKHLTEETKRKISEGQIGKTISEETREKLSKALKGRKLPPITEITRLKLKQSHKGQVAWNKGKKMSEESRKKMSEAHKGKSPSNKGMPMSEETKRKISESRKGQPGYWTGKKREGIGKGRKLSEETKKKMSESLRNKSKKIKCIETNIIYRSAADANEALRKPKSSNNIRNCLKGISKTAWGYHWEYIEE